MKDQDKIAINELKPYENNARTHSEEQLELLVNSINEFGFVAPVIIDENNVILVGHGRTEAAKRAGLTEVPYRRITHLTDDQKKAYILADNKLSDLSGWDLDLLDVELSDIELDMSQFGFEINNTDFFDYDYHGGAERQEGNDEYNEFLDKFELEKTTDDCYTPQIVFDAIEKWVKEQYKIKDKTIRPFYPGGDYQKENYNMKVVIDNPPFSILSEIISWYNDNGVKYFLFAPSVSCFQSGRKACAICVGATITYENGARVKTSFVTNLENNVARTAPDLYKIVRNADEINRERTQRHIPSYEYPSNVVTAAMLSKLSKYGQNLIIKDADASEKIAMLDAQKEYGKGIFGGGYLLAEKAAAEKAAETVWELSDREIEIIKNLG